MEPERPTEQVRPGFGTIVVPEETLLEDEELWSDDDGDDHSGWYCVRTDPFPCPAPACTFVAEFMTAAHLVLVWQERDDDEVRAHRARHDAWSRSVVVSKAVFGVALSVLLVILVLAARFVREDIRLREADRAARERTLVVQQRLMAVVSHDLRNPLSAMLVGASALARSDRSADPGPVLRRIIAAGTRMERLISDLLDWSRVERGAAIPIVPREADLYAVCEQMAGEARDREGDRVHVEREGDTCAVFDPDRMQQVIGNLLSNALRHAPAGTPVRVRAVGTADEVRLEVQDRGPGIPAGVAAKIFDPFWQGPGERGSGLGLGLFIVRALVEAHGGTIALESSAGMTTFAVRIPRGVSKHAPSARRSPDLVLDGEARMR